VDALMLRPFSPLNPRRGGLCVGVALQASFSAFRMLASGDPEWVLRLFQGCRSDQGWPIPPDVQGPDGGTHAGSRRFRRVARPAVAGRGCGPQGVRSRRNQPWLLLALQAMPVGLLVTWPLPVPVSEMVRVAVAGDGVSRKPRCCPNLFNPARQSAQQS
jgi:hypothetical protein